MQVAVLDDEGRIIEVNEAWTTFGSENGLTDREASVGENYLAVTEAADHSSVTEATEGLRALLRGERDSFAFEYPCHAPTEKRWFVLQAAAFQADGQRHVGVAHVDITERKRREQELQLYEALLENQLGVALLFDETGEVLLANQRLLEITALSEDAIVGRHYDDLPAAIVDNLDPFEEVRGLLAEVIDEGLQFASTEVEFSPADGHRMTADLRIIPYQIDAFSRGAILTARDVTEWQEREERLRLYERAVEGSSEMLAAVDTEFDFLFANEAYRAFHGLEDQDPTGVPLFEVIDDDITDQVRSAVEQVFDGELIHYRQERRGPDGKAHPIDIRYYPLRDRDGSIMGAVAAMRDMTEQNERERQLLVLDRVLRHNMHNDMNVIEGYARLVEEIGSGEAAEHAAKIAETAAQLLSTVDKQREITELLSKPHRQLRIDVGDTVREVVRTIRETYPEAEITVTGPEELHARTIPKVENAIHELVENAVKHVEGRRPQVTIERFETEDGIGIRVADNGPGIPEAERGVLTGEREIGPLYHGSGMGLWVVNWIVSRTGGTLSFAENDPHGSVVVLELPADGIERPAYG